jgi:hypothetical protein
MEFIISQGSQGSGMFWMNIDDFCYKTTSCTLKWIVTEGIWRYMQNFILEIYVEAFRRCDAF